MDKKDGQCERCETLRGPIDPKNVPRWLMEYCHRIIGTADGVEVRGDKGAIRIYKSASHARAHQDCEPSSPVRSPDQRPSAHVEAPIVASTEQPSHDQRCGFRILTREAAYEPSPGIRKRVKIGSDREGAEGGDKRAGTQATARRDSGETLPQSQLSRSQGQEEIRKWLEHRLDDSTSIPLLKQMWTTAGAVGGWEALEEWRNAISSWRSRKSLQPTRSLTVSTEDGRTTEKGLELATRKPHLAKVQPEIQAFCQVYDRLDESEMDETVKAVYHRLYLATLHQNYERALRVIEGGGARGQTKAARAKVQLFQYLHPGIAEVSEPRKMAPSKWKKFETRLKYGRRWAFLRDQLGVGIFWLIPQKILSHSFIEQTLRSIDQLEVWVELVRKRNPHAIRLGAATMKHIQGLFAQPPVSSKRRILETLEPLDLKAYLAREEDPTKIWEIVDEGVLTSADEESRPKSRHGHGGQPCDMSQGGAHQGLVTAPKPRGIPLRDFLPSNSKR